MPKPRKWRVVGCSRKCSINEVNLPGATAQTIHAWYEEGLTDVVMRERAAAIGLTLSQSGFARHRANHLVPEDQVVDLKVPKRPMGQQGLPTKKVSDLDLLDAMIAKGAENIHLPQVKVTSEQMLRAMELRYKLTQGSAFADFFTAIGAVMDDVTGETNPAALASEEEQEQGDAGD